MLNQRAWFGILVICWIWIPLPTASNVSPPLPASVEGPSFVVEPPGRLDFSNGTGGKLECQVAGRPRPTVTWTLLDGTPVSNVSGLRHVSADGTLSFAPFRSDQYRPDIHIVGYRCEASNPAGTIVSRDSHVKAVLTVDYDVLVYDEFSIRGNMAIMKCHIPQFLENYVTVIAWIRDDTVKIMASSEQDGKYWVSPHGSLYIRDVSTNDKGGTYKCQTRHSLTGETKISSTSGRIIVTDPRGSIPPKIVDGISSFSLAKGSKAFLPCIAHGFPAPTTTWLHRTLEGEKSVGSNGRIKATAHGLHITEVLESDVGMYICQVNSSTWTTTLEVSVHVTVPVHVRVEPEKKTLDVGQPLSLECHVIGHPVTSVSWAKDGQSLTDGRTQLTTDGVIPKLHIASIGTDDKGMYQCFVHSDRHVIQSGAQVSLGDFLPEFREVFEPSVREPGTSFTLRCTVIGNPTPEMTWTLDHNAITIGESVDVETKTDRATGLVSGTLGVQNARNEDGGLYACVAANRLGKIIHATKINVHGPLQSRVIPPLTAVAGEDAYLDCPVYGYPIESTWWKKDDHQLPSTVRQTVFPNGTLLIKKVQKSSDGGEFKCGVANNKGEQSQTTISLSVMVPPKVLPFAFQDELLREGMRARLQCVVGEGDSPVSVEWLKDGQPIKEDMGIAVRAMDEFSSILAIKMITPGHNGLYTCVAKNLAGVATQSAQLAVNVRPKIMPFAFQDDHFSVGGNIAVVCMLTEGDPPIVFSWTKDGLSVDTLEGISVVTASDFSSMLTVVNALPHHSGNYTCSVSNAAATAKFAATLRVNVTPKIVPFTFGDQYFAGVLARVSCVVYQGDLPLTITWFKDGHNIVPGSDMIIQTMDEFTSVLTIDNIQSKHSGNYTCVAKNAAAAASHAAQLVVKVPPKIVPFTFQDEQLAVGMFVRVSCVISRGDLPLDIQWLKDSRAIPADLGVVIRNFDEYSSVLSIDSLSWHHNGNYTCLASNAAATATFMAPLLVNVPPHWTKRPKGQATVVLMQHLQLHCDADGFPKPTVTWMTGDGSAITDSAIRSFSNGTLLFHSVKEEHEGYYVCKASNGIGEGLDQIVRLKVYDPPTILVQPQNKSVKVDQGASLSCASKGDSPLNITWLKDGKQIVIKSQSRYRINEDVTTAGLTSDLTIANIKKDDGSSYSCWAQNAYGEDRSNAVLTVQSQPDAPAGLVVQDAGNQTVHVSWKPPFNGNDVIRKYIVEYRPAIKGSRAYNKTAIGGQNLLTISGLLPASTYRFRMFAENDIGLSGSSEPVEMTIAGEAPSGAPRNVNVQALDSQTVKVSWQPPARDKWNGDIKGYYVGYRSSSSVEPFSFQLLEVPPGYDKGLSFTIPELQEFTKYAIVVQAFNDIGKGPLSAEILVMTSEDVPSKPPYDVRCSTISSDKISVTWKPPHADTVNGILRGHRSLYWPVDSWDGKRVGVVNSTLTTTTTLEELEPFTNYSIQVVSYTLAGDGVPSKPVFCRTWEDVPGSPAEMKCVSASSESVAVYWMPPQSTNGHITHYNVYAEDPGNGRQANHKVPGHQSHLEVLGLKRSLRYKLWVTASSVLGEGKASQPVYCGPAASVVAAKCITFGRTFKVVQGNKVALPCPMVGAAPLEFLWSHGLQEVTMKNRLQVLPENSLQISKIQNSDAGNYTCQAKNDFGEDAVTHILVVQMPPPPPSVSVVMATFNSVGLRWKLRANGDSSILGYVLRFKPEFGSWDSLELQPYQESHTLRNLRCGSSYEITLAAINEVGVGEASELLTVTTDGGAPVAPPVTQLIEESTTHCTLHLDSWVTNGCPILYFTVEYRARKDSGWTLVTKGVKPNQRMLVVADLEHATWYSLRMTAHSTSGTTVSEYDFSTLSVNEGDDYKIKDLKEIANTISQVDLTVVAPSAACALIIILCLVATCFWVRRRRRQQEAQAKQTMEATGTIQRPQQAHRHDSHRATLASLRRSAGQAEGADSDDEISPYAMVRLSDFQPGTPRASMHPPTSSNMNNPGQGWHQASSQAMFGGPFHHAPTAPPMSETYGAGGVYPTGMLTGGLSKNGPLGQPYAQPLKNGKRGAAGAHAAKMAEANAKPSETTFVFPAATDGDYDPPPEFKWPFPKQ